MTKKEERAEDIAIKQYELSFKQVLNEGNVVWNSLTFFILANTIIIGVIFQKFNNFNFFVSIPDSVLFSLSTIGLLINFLWLITFIRRWEWYKIRMAQASDKEEKLIKGFSKNKGWELISGIGKDFSDGKPVVIQGREPYQHNIITRHYGTNKINLTFISIFIAIFAYLVIYTNTFSILKPISHHKHHHNLYYMQFSNP